MAKTEKNKYVDLEELIPGTVSQCRHHLKEIIDTKPVVYWAEQLDVSKGLISARWKKDHFPNIPNIIKLLLLSGYSANWLLLGIGPKYMTDVYDPDQSAADELRRREMTVELFELENQLSEKAKKLKEIERYIEAHKDAAGWIKDAFDDGIFSKTSQEIKAATGKSVFNQFILPLMTLLQSINHIGFKLLETVASSEDSGGKILEIIKFIKLNLEKNQFGLQSSLADLDTLIEDTGIT